MYKFPEGKKRRGLDEKEWRPREGRMWTGRTHQIRPGDNKNTIGLWPGSRRGTENTLHLTDSRSDARGSYSTTTSSDPTPDTRPTSSPTLRCLVRPTPKWSLLESDTPSRPPSRTDSNFFPPQPTTPVSGPSVPQTFGLLPKLRSLRENRVRHQDQIPYGLRQEH